MAKKKRRKVRWDRVLLLSIFAVILFSSVAGGTYLLFDKVSATGLEETSVTGDVLTTKGETEKNLIPVMEKILTQVDEAEKTEWKNSAEEEPERIYPKQDDNLVYLGSFLLTGYCPCEQCSEGWDHQTASGAYATEGRTVAVDPEVIPYGTRLLIDGHEYIAEDCGGAIGGKHIDVFMENHEDCFDESCNGYHEVYAIYE